MNDEQWQKIDDILQAALDLEPRERPAFLDKACAGDTELRGKVESLLARETFGERFLETPAIQIVAREFAESDLAGQQIGHYQIVELIGTGGMGEVYLAEDTRLNRRVAIKFLSTLFTADVSYVRRFEQEARAASALNHPNIITIHEVGQHEGQHFIVTELIEGLTLRKRLAMSKLTVKETINIATQVASAMNAAHKAGIFHCDIKPENLMLRADGLVKVLDFGIAKLGRREGGTERLRGGLKESVRDNDLSRYPSLAQSLTMTGAVMGTASYMSPEQARGLEVDGRSDLFSLGAVIYEMVIGERLFPNATPVEVTEQLLRPQEPLPTVAKFSGKAKPLEPVIRKCLRRKREERYQSAEELLGELQRLERQLDTRFIRRVVTAVSLAAILAIVAFGLVIPESIHEEWVPEPVSDGHTKAVRRCAFSPDGKLLVTVSDDGLAIVWDFDGRRRLATIEDHKAGVGAVAFSPNGKHFVTAAENATAFVWEIVERTDVAGQVKSIRLQKVVELGGQKERIDSLTFSPDGNRLVSMLHTGLEPGNQSGQTIIWETIRWRELRRLPVGFFLVVPLFLDSRRIIIEGEVWDIESGRMLDGTHRSELNDDGRLNAISPDGRIAVRLDGCCWVAFWQINPFKLLHRQLVHEFFTRAAAVSHNGRWAVSGAENIVFWDLMTLEPITSHKHKDNVWDLKFSPDDRWLVSTHGDGAVLIWDAAKRKLVANLSAHSGKINAVDFAPDGKRFITAGDDHSIIVWDAATKQKETSLTAHEIAIKQVKFLDANTLVSFDLFSNLFLWNLTELRYQQPFPRCDQLESGIISPNGRWMFADGFVIDMNQKRKVFDFKSVNSKLMRGTDAFSDDSHWLFVVTIDYQEMYLLDLTTLQITDHAEVQDIYPIRSAFCPGSDLLAIGGSKGEVAVWNVHPLRPIAMLGKHQNHVQSISFSKDGNQIVSASDDSTVKVWDVKRKRLVSSLEHTAPVLSAAFSPDGKRIVTGGHDEIVRLYTRRRTLWGWPIE